MRASDADRDQVADRLREALAEGRITAEEHAERIDVVYNAKTYADLEPVLSDLPADQPAGETAEPRVNLRKEAAPPPVSQPASIIAIFSGAERKGRWLVEPHTNISIVFGGVMLDMRQAVLSQREVTVNVTNVFGGLEVIVPPGVRVQWAGATVFGGTDLPEDDLVEPDAPVVRLTGMILFGGVTVHRRAAGDLTRAERRRERRHRHRELHDHHREVHERHREMLDERREHLRRLRDERRESRRRH